jgi:hypothetical protein
MRPAPETTTGSVNGATRVAQHLFRHGLVTADALDLFGTSRFFRDGFEPSAALPIGAPSGELQRGELAGLFEIGHRGVHVLETSRIRPSSSANATSAQIGQLCPHFAKRAEGIPPSRHALP